MLFLDGNTYSTYFSVFDHDRQDRWRERGQQLSGAVCVEPHCGTPRSPPPSTPVPDCATSKTSPDTATPG